ncbi:uncharacterized protein LOC135205555 [Macrobrachium nipponense]|uniref:uncharacterized protein LOC135205555 n=1 Tax=Macrobrachium nipponense TaxID=159736 RepID=UPI0030C8033C
MNYDASLSIKLQSSNATSIGGIVYVSLRMDPPFNIHDPTAGRNGRNLQSRVFNLQTDIWSDPSTEAFLRYNFSGERPPLEALSVCYRFSIQQYRDGVFFLSYATSDAHDNALLFYQREDTMNFYYNDVEASVSMKLWVEDTLDVWHHHCHLIRFPNYRFYVDGKLRGSGEMVGENGVLRMNGTVYIGQEQDSFAGGLDRLQTTSAYITQINVWDYLLQELQITEMASCRANHVGNVLSTDESKFEVMNVIAENRSVESFCTERSEFTLIPEKWHLGPSIKFCQVSNSEIFVPDDEGTNERLFMETRRFLSQCGGKSYRLLRLGATDRDSEGSWRKFGEKEVIPFAAWATGEPNDGLKSDCIVMKKSLSKWGDVDCKDEYCFSCLKIKSKYLQIRGLCYQKEHQSRFILDGYVNDKPFFRGYYGYAVFLSENGQWILKDIHGNVTMAVMERRKIPTTDYPLGRHKWTVVTAFCQNLENDGVEISLSPCTTEEFTCSDGSCVPATARCNLLSDCLDGSDEDRCNLLEFHEGYHGHRPPPGITPKDPLEINPTINIVRFSNIDDISLAINMELEVILRWTDRNLGYKNLKRQTENKLSSEEEGKVWIPEYEFLNVNDGRLQVLKRTVFVNRTGHPDPPHFNDVEMDTIFPSTSGEMAQRILYSASFNCNFRLFYYPFDVQTCSVLLKLTSATSAVITFKNASVEYQGLKNLPKYAVREISASLLNINSNDALEVTFQLERRYSLLVLTIFIPTGLLLVIGYTTLFVKLQLLQVRAIMTLTTLLVLYTLFNQVSSNLPDTAYIKMVDVWFFFCIFLIFSVIVLHIVVENLDPGVPKGQQSQVIKVAPSAGLRPRSNPVATTIDSLASSPCCCLLTANGLLRFVRIYLYPLVLLTFNLVFWIMILSK